MARTIYVVNWTPDAVGGFEWRLDRAEAEAVAADLRKSDPTVQLHEVELPEDEEWTKYPDAITERLDAEGWSDGGDPRNVRGCSCGMADYGAPGHDGDPAADDDTNGQDRDDYTPSTTMTRDDLYDGIARLCQSYGYASERTYDLIHELVASVDPDGLARELHGNGVHTHCPADCLTRWDDNGDDRPGGAWIVTNAEGGQLAGPFDAEDLAEGWAEQLQAQGFETAQAAHVSDPFAH